MRKFWIGMACGVLLCLMTAAVSSQSIQGKLFPSKISIFNGGQVKELSTDTGSVVINYKGHTYIPLRLFSGAMGADVTFQPATADNGNVNRIQVISKSSQAGLDLKSNDGYVAAGHFVYDQTYKGVVRGGIIRINKDLSGKRIVLEAVKADGRVAGTSEYFYIEDENLIPPKPGDVRSFKTTLAYAYEESEITYRLKVLDIVNKINNPLGEISGRELDYVTFPLNGSMFPRSGFGFEDWSSVTDQPVVSFSFTLTNLSEAAVVLDETPLSLAVYNANPDGSKRELLSRRTLPSLKGKLVPDEAFELQIPWYLSDRNGLVKPGNYLVALELPEQIQLLNEATGKKQAWKVSLRYGSEFLVTLK